MIHRLIFQDGSNKIVELTESLYTLGRSRDCSIHLKPVSVSRFHAYLMRVAEDTYNIEDGSTSGSRSKSGIFIKKPNSDKWEKRTSAKLEDGDCVKFPPDVVFQYSKCCPDMDGTEHGTVY
ncbi:MAG TPA: FHA domain-containing protein [Coleofasciculaceae cyanobacterium]